MDTPMELDELKQAWQALGRQLDRQQALDLELLREVRLEKARRGLRPLIVGQCLQAVLGVALVVLGVACWTRNTDVAGLLIAGLLVHGFGLLHVILAGIILGLATTIDYGASVLRIQARLARLLRLQGLNSAACGMPWWIMWVVVVVAVAGLGDGPRPTSTPGWMWGSLGVGVAGLLGTWLYARYRRQPPAGVAESGCAADGTDAIRRGQRVLDDLARFERGE
jgi:hypothetical protein